MINFSIIQGLLALGVAITRLSARYWGFGGGTSKKRGNRGTRLSACYWHGVFAPGICYLALELYCF